MMDYQKCYEVDLGNLTAFNPHHHFTVVSSSREELVKGCLEEGTKIVQEIVSCLFNLPSTESKDGPIVKLPPPTTKLPREKPLPKPRPLTKWEEFAKKKGIKRRKKDKTVYDENTHKWKRRHGYDRVNDDKDIPIIEAKDGDDGRFDPFVKRIYENKKRVEKQEGNRLKNMKHAARVGVLPSHIKLGLDSLKMKGKEEGKKAKKEELQEVASTAAKATASVGKFDRKLAGEKPEKHKGKYRKFMAAAGRGGGDEERDQTEKVMKKVLGRMTDTAVDVNRAVRVHNVRQEKQRLHQHRRDAAAAAAAHHHDLLTKKKKTRLP